MHDLKTFLAIARVIAICALGYLINRPALRV